MILQARSQHQMNTRRLQAQRRQQSWGHRGRVIEERSRGAETCSKTGRVDRVTHTSCHLPTRCRLTPSNRHPARFINQPSYRAHKSRIQATNTHQISMTFQLCQAGMNQWWVTWPVDLRWISQPIWTTLMTSSTTIFVRLQIWSPSRRVLPQMSKWSKSKQKLSMMKSRALNRKLLR